MPSPEHELERKQLLTLLVQAVQELPPECQEAFRLHKLEGLSHEEVARCMGISRNMVEKHMIRAMLYIRQRMEQWESSS